MQFLHPERDRQLELALDDVFIVPSFFEGTSRTDVDLSPHDFGASSHPIVSANMNAVTGKRMAETLARSGGLGVLPQDMDRSTVERIVRHIKDAHPRFDTALTVTATATLRDAQGLIRKRSHDLVVVIDDDNRPAGVITPSNWRGQDQYTPVGRVMSDELVKVRARNSNREAFLLMEAERIKAAPVVDDDGVLVGVLTRDEAVRQALLSPSLDPKGRLQVAAAVGISSDVGEVAGHLVEIGVDAIVIDTAHGHQRRMMDAINAVRKTVGRTPVIAGNVCTEEGTADLIEAGADVVKVNVGPGAMCTTRLQTGVGRPTFSAVAACAARARSMGRHVWADGGVRYPRDVSLYLAAGASRVMIGTMLAGTYESPGDLREDQHGHLYKENYGMASARAVHDRTSHLDPYDRAQKAVFREGISTSQIYLREGFESVGNIVIDIISGVQSAMTYVGATDLQSFFDLACVGVQTTGGFHEGTPHGRVRR